MDWDSVETWLRVASQSWWGVAIAATLVFGLGLALGIRIARRAPARAVDADPPPPPARAIDADPPQPPAERAAAKPRAKSPTATSARSATARPAHHVLVLAGEAHSAQLTSAIAMRCVCVKNAVELVTEAKRDKPVAAFVDADLLSQLNGKLGTLPVVGLVDAKPGESLPAIVRTFDAYPSLSNVVVAPLLETPRGRTHLNSLLDRLAGSSEHDLLGAASVGRVALLAQASRREGRFARMHEFFAKQDVSPRTITALQDIAEELVMNALYNAPAEAGTFEQPVSRTEDVTLPLDRACEISYGIEAAEAFVRVRDTFGSLRRDRLLEVLTRCAANDVELDESRGGAGLGMWRIFSSASTIAITVIPNRLTDILVRVSVKPGRDAKQLLAAQMFFSPATTTREALVLDGDDRDDSMFDHSITLIQA